jgi:hypothetical protein
VINYATGVLSITYVVAPDSGAEVVLEEYSYADPSSALLAVGVDQMPTLNADSVVTVLE